MDEQLRTVESPSTEIDGGKLPGPEENFRCDFEAVALALWPGKTDHELAAISGKSDRAAREWLAGRVEPPGCILTEILARCTRPRR